MAVIRPWRDGAKVWQPWLIITHSSCVSLWQLCIWFYHKYSVLFYTHLAVHLPLSAPSRALISNWYQWKQARSMQILICFVLHASSLAYLSLCLHRLQFTKYNIQRHTMNYVYLFIVKVIKTALSIWTSKHVYSPIYTCVRLIKKIKLWCLMWFYL